ncbi:MAG: UbiX family flavin prenyltransferase [Veillonella sp.]|uniref:UbiX family flavin prenyltransferase n=1 Tax=Veillonella atypica TaxID=39777 RepID=UPI0022E8E0BE|nr:UbiX family flavin prenyltransferase [Veillonella atypica]MDU2580631.1 UbiX family flavin prenyltransferase [Veillonella sp.]MDU3930278.1 UbiX family flavin prenyltransferase [Veillonella sp.]
MRLIVGVSGASGVILGYYVLKALRQITDIEVHLVMTEGAKATLQYESTITVEEMEGLADVVHDSKNMAATISSGSFKTDGMIVVPCSMKSVAGMACGFADNLLLRAADVCFKENRKVVLVPREMPLSRIHLRNLTTLAEYGCTIIPPLLTFYNDSNSVEKQINHIVGKILMQFGFESKNFIPWTGRNMLKGDKHYAQQ